MSELAFLLIEVISTLVLRGVYFTWGDGIIFFFSANVKTNVENATGLLDLYKLPYLVLSCENSLPTFHFLTMKTLERSVCLYSVW